MSLASQVRGLYGIADGGFRPSMLLSEKLHAFFEGGARLVQLRLKGLGGAEWLARAREAVELARRSPQRPLLLLNDRPDLAALAGADGAHIGDEDVPVAAARSILGPGKLLGATVRSLEEALEAAKQGADYVGFGPIYATSTKLVDHEAQGLSALARLAERCPVPVVAIAGITLERAAEVARAGAAAAAVVSAVLGAERPAEAARALSLAFERGRREREGAGGR